MILARALTGRLKVHREEKLCSRGVEVHGEVDAGLRGWHAVESEKEHTRSLDDAAINFTNDAGICITYRTHLRNTTGRSVEMVDESWSALLLQTAP